MNMLQLYTDFGIPHATEGHRHCRPGWVNVVCPFCVGHEGLHLGFSLDNGFYTCWRCGHHSTPSTVAKLIGVTTKEAQQILKQYRIGKSIVKEIKIKIRRKAHRLPNGTNSLGAGHKLYLEKRGFDPDKLEREWNLFATGPIGKLDDIDYKHRIIAPIIWNNEQVSFQARDITDKSPYKYLTCPKDRELIHHKHILYGKQEEWGNIGICVEGITDVWRFGVKAFCTFGIKYTNKQIRVMAKTFKRIAVVFDNDPQAIIQANKLVSDLRFRNIKAWRINIEGDPGSMPQKDADSLVHSIMLLYDK